MNNKILSLMSLLLLSLSSFAADDRYSGSDKPILSADNQQIRIKLEQCIEDVNEVMDDSEGHDNAKQLCQIRKNI